MHVRTCNVHCLNMSGHYLMQLAPGLASEDVASDDDAHMVTASAGAIAKSSLHVC